MRALIFETMGDRFAADVSYVERTARNVPLTFVPGLPRAVRGIMNIGGKVVAAIDLNAALNAESAPPRTGETATCVLLKPMEGASRTAVLADKVTGIIELDEADLKPPPLPEDDPGAALLQGVADTPEGLIRLISADALLA